MMFCTSTQIICADLVKLEWENRQKKTKKKEGSERHCLGVASLLFILSKHSVILIPPSPRVTGQEQRSVRQNEPEGCKPASQHLGEISPAIPIQQLTEIYQC